MDFTDQIGHRIKLGAIPKRIVSLVPSQSELLIDLGLGDSLIGVTKFCIHPASLRKEKKVVGGTKAIHIDRIIELNPDLIIANKEENRKEDIELLQQKFAVWTSDIKTLEDACEMVGRIGQICSVQKESEILITEIKGEFANLSPVKLNKRALYLIWKDPYMAAGKETFIHSMLGYAGFQNVLTAQFGRYPELSVSDISRLKPDVLLLSSEPFPFKGVHTESIKTLFPDIKVMEVDGELFSWYGSRLKHAPTYFTNLRRAAELT